MSQSTPKLTNAYPKGRANVLHSWMSRRKEKFEFCLRFHQCSLNLMEDISAILRLKLGCWETKKTKPFFLKTNVPTQFTEPVTLKFKATLKKNLYERENCKSYKPYDKTIQIVSTKSYGKDKKLVLGEAKMNLANFVLNPSFYMKIPITTAMDSHAYIIMTNKATKVHWCSSSAVIEKTCLNVMPTPSVHLSEMHCNAGLKEPEPCGTSSYHSSLPSQYEMEFNKMSLDSTSISEPGFHNTKENPLSHDTDDYTVSPLYSSRTSKRNPFVVISSKPHLEKDPNISELSFSKDSLQKEPNFYEYQLSCKLQPSQSTISGHLLSTNEETLSKLTLNTCDRKASDKHLVEKDSWFVRDLQSVVEQKNKTLAELEAILDSKTTTIVELQNEMYITVKELDTNLKRKTQVAQILKTTLDSLRQEKEEQVKQLTKEFHQATRKVVSLQQSLDTFRDENDILLEHMRQENIKLKNDIQYLTEELKKRSIDIQILTNAQNEVVPTVTPPIDHKLIQVDIPLPLKAIHFKRDNVTKISVYDTEIATDLQNKIQYLQTALQQSHDYQTKLKTYITRLENGRLCDGEGTQKIKELEEALVQSKLEVAEVKTEYDIKISTYEARIKQLIDSNNQYLDLVTDLQIQVLHVQEDNSKRKRFLKQS